DYDKVTAGRIVTRSRKLRAIRLKKRLVAAPILRPPYALLAHEDRTGNNRVRDDRFVECRGFSKQRSGNNDPLARVAVLEVRIRVICEERVEALRGVADVETRLASIAVDNLIPRDGRAVGFERAVVLIPALQMCGVVWSNRNTLELNGRKS